MNIFPLKSLEENTDVEEFYWSSFIKNKVFPDKVHCIRPENVSMKSHRIRLGVVIGHRRQLYFTSSSVKRWCG